MDRPRKNVWLARKRPAANNSGKHCDSPAAEPKILGAQTSSEKLLGLSGSTANYLYLSSKVSALIFRGAGVSWISRHRTKATRHRSAATPTFLSLSLSILFDSTHPRSGTGHALLARVFASPCAPPVVNGSSLLEHYLPPSPLPHRNSDYSMSPRQAIQTSSSSSSSSSSSPYPCPSAPHPSLHSKILVSVLANIQIRMHFCLTRSTHFCM
jgi:hypothetical protein